MSDSKVREAWLNHFPVTYKGYKICKVCNIILCPLNSDSKCNDKKPRNARAYIDDLKRKPSDESSNDFDEMKAERDHLRHELKMLQVTSLSVLKQRNLYLEALYTIEVMGNDEAETEAAYTARKALEEASELKKAPENRGPETDE